jgi:hypothetical protein
MRPISTLRLRANGVVVDLDLDLFLVKASMECLIHHLLDGSLLVKGFHLAVPVPGTTSDTLLDHKELPVRPAKA